MIKKTVLFTFLCLLIFKAGYPQKFSRTLLKADKLYIKKDYRNAVLLYEKYLRKNQRDFYGSRQAARCYGRLNDPSMAIDYWPAVIENGEASETDNFDYARCLLANYRTEDARKVFISLSRSSNKSISAWGKAYMNPGHFFRDSALCKVTEVSGINTAGHEFCPVVRNGTLYFISDEMKGVKVTNAIADQHVLEIRSAALIDSTHVQPPVIFIKPAPRKVNGPFCFSGDGNTLFLSRAIYSKDLGIRKVEPFYRFQLYTAPTGNPDAGQAFQYNLADHDLMHPFVSADGKRLYFSSDRKGSLGGKDIFVCELVNGEWAEPVNLGPEVNTAGNETFPCLSDEGQLYFVSDARPGLGGLDIFIAEPASGNSRFKEARNAGSPINSQFDDYGIFLLPGGKTGYLSSNRKNNTDDDVFYFRNSKPALNK
jgi:hypothetical protein